MKELIEKKKEKLKENVVEEKKLENDEENDDDECFPVDAPIKRHSENIADTLSDEQLLSIADHQLNLLDYEYQECIKNSIKPHKIEEVPDVRPSESEYKQINQNENDDDDKYNSDNEPEDNLFGYEEGYIRKPHQPLPEDKSIKIKNIIESQPQPKYPAWIENLNIDKLKKMNNDIKQGGKIKVKPQIKEAPNLNDYPLPKINPGSKSNKKGKKNKKHKK